MSENELVRAFNDFFNRNDLNGIAYRRKQHTFSSQFLDIIVNSSDLGHIAIEHKSYKTSASNKLYFSQHFSTDANEDALQPGHQIDRIKEFQDRSGINTFLAVEIRRGRGVAKEIYIMEWDEVYEYYEDWKENDGRPGFSREWFKENAWELERNIGDVEGYIIDDRLFS